MNIIKCGPTLEGYINILKKLKEVKNPSELQKETIDELETYIQQQEALDKFRGII